MPEINQPQAPAEIQPPNPNEFIQTEPLTFDPNEAQRPAQVETEVGEGEANHQEEPVNVPPTDPGLGQ